MPVEVSNRTSPAGELPSFWVTVAVRVAGLLVPYVCEAADAASVVVETALFTVNVSAAEVEPTTPRVAEGTNVAVICNVPAGVFAGTW